jgi:hypothetical protein
MVGIPDKVTIFIGFIFQHFLFDHLTHFFAHGTLSSTINYPIRSAVNLF